MPGRNGTGPMGTERGTGRQMGGCFENAPATFSAAYGYGCHIHRRLRDGKCRFSGVTDSNALAAEKEILENRLKLIDRKLNEVSAKSTDRPNG
jgi:hypothetical protein